MNDIVDIRAKLREVERANMERRASADRALVSLFIREQGEGMREAERFADRLVFGVLAVLFFLFVLPDLAAWLHGLLPVLVTP